MSYVIALCIGVLICITIMMMFTRSMILQRLGTLEFFTLIAVTMCILFGYRETSSIVKEQYIELMSIRISEVTHLLAELEVAYQTAGSVNGLYQELETEIYNVLDNTSWTEMEEIHVNAVLIQRETDGGYVECKTIGENSGFLKENELLLVSLIEEAVSGNQISAKEISDGNILFAIVAKASTAPNYTILAEMPIEKILSEKLELLRQRYLIYGAIVLMVASIVYVVVILRESRELRKIIEFTARISAGIDDAQNMWDNQAVGSAKTNEMRALYNGLRQIANAVMRINYAKYKTLQVYYRFAPKDIEKIMGKKSILDVKIDEHVKMEATLAYISFNINEKQKLQEQFKYITDCYNNLGEKRKKHNGIIFNSSCDLSISQMMFRNEVSEAVQFGIEMASGDNCVNDKNNAFVLLHRTSFIYGVAGDNEQNFTYVHSAEMKCIEKYIEQLRNIGVHMIVTDYVYSRIKNDTLCRYAGYVEEGELKFHLYEVLEVYPERERQARMEMLAKFEQAIKLFYQADFYFARTLFTEILKACPNDELAKHYIFKCESCLNNYAMNSGFSLFE